MDLSFFATPPGIVVIAAAGAFLGGLFGTIVTARTMRRTHAERLRADQLLADKRAAAEMALAERRFQLDTDLADRRRRQDLAEEVLSGFYRLADQLRAIRSPYGVEGEAKDRPQPPGESAAAARQRDTYYAVLARFETRRAAIGDLLSRRHRMVAWFGPDAGKPFDEIADALARVRRAAQMLVAHSGDDDAYRNANMGPWTEWEADIWWGPDDGKDPIAARIDAATRSIERICRPALGGETATAPTAPELRAEL